MLKVGDCVKFKNGKETCYGYIDSKIGNNYSVKIGYNDFIILEENQLKKIIVPIYDEEKLRQLFRFEKINFSIPLWLYETKEGEMYSIRLCDILVGLYNAKKDIKHAKEWLYFIFKEIIYDYRDMNDSICLPSDFSELIGFPTEFSIFCDVFNHIDEDNKLQDVIDSKIDLIETYIDNIKKPYDEWVLTVDQKERFLNYWDNDNMLNRASDFEKGIIKKIAFELAEENNEVGLRVLAYGYYSGGIIFPVDFDKSRDYLIKLLPFDKGGFYANTLGYIFYYGRCNNGIPQYEEAFKYFSLGHLHGVFESTYKLADLFTKGYGVCKDTNIAYRLTKEVYDYNIHMLYTTQESKFADAALRMGSLAKEIESTYNNNNFNKAYYYYLQADFTLRQRMNKHSYVGDTKVYAAIQKCIQETYPLTSYIKNTIIDINELSDILMVPIACKQRIDAQLIIDGNKSKIILKNNDKNSRLLITIPQISFCGLVDKVTFGIIGYNDNDLLMRGINHFIFDKIINGTFYLDGKEILKLEDVSLTIKKKKPSAEKEYTIASCWFNPNGKLYDYICDTEHNVGETISIENEYGKSNIEIVRICTKKESELVLPIKMYKHI